MIEIRRMRTKDHLPFFTYNGCSIGQWFGEWIGLCMKIFSIEIWFEWWDIIGGLKWKMAIRFLRKMRRCFLLVLTSIRSKRRLISFNCCSYCRIWFSIKEILFGLWLGPFARCRSSSPFDFYRRRITTKSIDRSSSLDNHFHPTSSCLAILSNESLAFFVSNVFVWELLLSVLFDRSGNVIVCVWARMVDTRPFWLSVWMIFWLDVGLIFGWPRRVNWA